MVAKGFGRRLLVVLSIMGAVALFGLLDLAVSAAFFHVPSDSPVASKLFTYLFLGPIVASLLLLAAYCVLYPLVNLVLATVTYLVSGEVVTLGRLRQRAKERIRARETEAYSQKLRDRERMAARKKAVEQDYEEALRELDREFPGIKLENDLTGRPSEEGGRKGTG